MAHIDPSPNSSYPADEAPSEGGNSGPARQAIRELEEQLALRSTKSDAEIALEMAKGSQLVKDRWIRDGWLVGSTELEAAWSRSSQDLLDACEQGELICLEISGARWYPSIFLNLDSTDVAAVCQAMAGLDALSVFLFWHRKHGALKGQTLHQAVLNGELQAVLHVSKWFARESLGQLPPGATAD